MIQLQFCRISSDAVKPRFYPANKASLSLKSIFLFPQNGFILISRICPFLNLKKEENKQEIEMKIKVFNIVNSQNASLSRHYSISILNIWG